jgi:hypothetical protein
MAAHIVRTLIARHPLRTLSRRLAAFGAVTIASLLMQGCAGAPRQPVVGPDPSNARVGVPQVRYQPVVTGVNGRRPVAPGDWREQSEGIAPSKIP